MRKTKEVYCNFVETLKNQISYQTPLDTQENFNYHIENGRDRKFSDFGFEIINNGQS